MNGLDLLLLAVMAWQAWRGFQKGLLGAVVGMVGWLLALYLGSFLARDVAPWFHAWTADPALQMMLGFVAVVLLVLLCLWAAVQIWRSVLQAVALGLLEQLAGALLGALKGVLLILIVMSVLAPWASQSPVWQQSRIVPILMPYAPLAAQLSKQVASTTWKQLHAPAQ